METNEQSRLRMSRTFLATGEKVEMRERIPHLLGQKKGVAGTVAGMRADIFVGVHDRRRLDGGDEARGVAGFVAGFVAGSVAGLMECDLVMQRLESDGLLVGLDGSRFCMDGVDMLMTPFRPGRAK